MLSVHNLHMQISKLKIINTLKYLFQDASFSYLEHV